VIKDAQIKRLEQEIEQIKRQRFELMAIRLAKHLDLADCDNFDDLPGDIRDLLNGYKYFDLIFPLMQKDRDELSLSYRQLEIKYGVPKSTIQLYLNDPKKK